MPDPVAELPLPEAGEQLPFRVTFDETAGKVVLWATIEKHRSQSVRRIEVPSLEALTIAVAEHLRESRVQQRLAESLVEAATEYLGADPIRIYAAARELTDPMSTIPLGKLLAGLPAGAAS